MNWQVHTCFVGSVYFNIFSSYAQFCPSAPPHFVQIYPAPSGLLCSFSGAALATRVFTNGGAFATHAACFA